MNLKAKISLTIIHNNKMFNPKRIHHNVKSASVTKSFKIHREKWQKEN